MDQFTRCQDCNRGQLTPPDIICLECVNSHHHLLSILDERVASGEITEGEYITECNILRDNHTTAPNMGTHPGPTAWEQSQSVMERMIEAYLTDWTDEEVMWWENSNATEIQRIWRGYRNRSR
tara:strand:- start:155 stop:523 length:369 start_codon:yes stop_codon:yes gene_type:complete